MKSAYIILYRREILKGGLVQVFLPLKQVISFKALYLLFRNEGKREKVLDLLRNPEKVAKALDGIPREFGRRIDGTILPAGGKIATVGGRVEDQEEPKRGATRELLEELCLPQDPPLIQTILQNLSVVREVKVGNWIGIYYGLDIAAVDKLNNFDFHKMQAKIQEFELSLKNETQAENIKEQCSKGSWI